MSVLNVFKTSVDTINASSITSDMTIGANLNGGSLTIGGTSINIGKVNSVTNFSSGTINASNFKLYSTIDVYNQSAWLDTIGTTITPQLVLGYNNASQVYLGSPNTPLIVIGGDKGTVKIANDGLVAGARINIATGPNATNTEMFLGSPTLSYNNIRGNIIHIADTGLSATGKVHIASGVNGGNATGSEIKIGDVASLTTFKGNTIVDGSTVNSGTNIFCIKQNTGSIDNATDGIRDPLTISSPSGSTTAFLSLGMGVDTTYNCAYINCAMVGQGRPLVLSPRLGNVFVGPIPAGFDTASNSYTGYTNGNLIVSGNIYCNSPIIPKYSYGYGLNRIGGRYDNGGSGGAVLTIYGDGNWRNYLYCNDVPPGLYLFQYWANPGGMTYTNIQQRIHLSPTPFTGNSNIINNITLYSQTYVNPVPSLFGGVQTPHTFTLMVDSSNPHVCFAMLCNTNVNAATYHGLMLTRIA